MSVSYSTSYYSGMNLISFLIAVLVIVANWQVYKKMGREGWNSIIPFYSSYVLFEVIYGNGWKFLTLLIPFYNIYVYFKLCIDWAAGFNKSTGFGVGIALVSAVFLPLLAFDKEVVWKDNTAPYQSDFVDNILGKVDDLAAPESEEVKELKKLKSLHEQGLITDEEYEERRSNIVNKI